MAEFKTHYEALLESTPLGIVLVMYKLHALPHEIGYNVLIKDGIHYVESICRSEEDVLLVLDKKLSNIPYHGKLTRGIRKKEIRDWQGIVIEEQRY